MGCGAVCDRTGTDVKKCRNSSIVGSQHEGWDADFCALSAILPITIKKLKILKPVYCVAGLVSTSREKHASELRHGDYMCGLVTMVGHMPGLNVFAETVSRPVRRRDGCVDDTEH